MPNDKKRFKHLTVEKFREIFPELATNLTDDRIKKLIPLIVFLGESFKDLLRIPTKR